MSVVRIVAINDLVRVVEETQNLVVIRGAFDPNYGSFYDTTDQPYTGNSTGQAMRFNTTAFARNVEIVDGYKIRINKPGKYNIQFSAQYEKSTGGTHPVDIWLTKNGTNIANSASVIVVTDGSGEGSRIIAAWNFFVESAANDDFAIQWWSDNAAVSIIADPAQTTPTRPAIPSIILTVNQIG